MVNIVEYNGISYLCIRADLCRYVPYNSAYAGKILSFLNSRREFFIIIYVSSQEGNVHSKQSMLKNDRVFLV